MTASDALDQVVRRVREHSAIAEYASNLAIGVASDDYDSDPALVVIVYQGKVFSLEIADSYLNCARADAAILINAVIRLAYASWRGQMEALVAEATQVMEDQGSEAGAEHLRSLAEEHSPL